MLNIRVYGQKGNPVFKASEGGCDFADFDSFEAVPVDVRAAATSCRVVAVVATNGYRLGTHPSLGDTDVPVTANGDTVRFTAPNAEVAELVWNNHAKGMGEWLQETLRPVAAAGGVRIRVYGSEQDPLLIHRVGDGRAYSDFDGVDAVPSHLRRGATTYVFTAVTPDNGCFLGEYPVGGKHREDREPQSAVVMATGKGVSVSSGDFEFARLVFGFCLSTMDRNPETAQDAYDSIMEMRQDALGYGS